MRYHFFCLASMVVFVSAGERFAWPQELLLDSFDKASLKFAVDKGGQTKLVDGKVGQALQLTFPDNSKSVFATRPARATPAWDEAAGFSFWVKGEGKPSFGGLQLIWGDDYALRYDFAFPIDGEWRKVVVPWRELIPVLPSSKAKPLKPTENAPSKVTQLWFGKWWYWRDVGAQTYAVDELRLEPTIELDSTDYKPASDSLARVAAKLKAGQPITMVTMGDSLTDVKHWTNQKTNWPAILKAKLKERFGSEVTIVNPAIGGTQLRQNLVLMPLWTQANPAPDLVTVCFGYNDWDAGMRGPQFLAAHSDGVDRIRRATKGMSDVLLFTPARALSRWDEMAELGNATREAASARRAGLVDLEAAFEVAGQDDRARLFVHDKVHLSLAGQEVVADAVLKALIDAVDGR